MTTSSAIASTRLAGALYLIIIVCGVAAGVFRAPFVGDDSAIVAAVVDNAAALRVSALFDVVMALADVGVGVALFVAFAGVAGVRALSGAALAFRLVQAAAITINLVALLVAVELGVGENALAGTFVRAHAVGYDLSLFFFAVNCALMGVVVARAGFGPRWLGFALGTSGAVYLVGSTLRVLAPSLADAFAAAYVLPLIAELAFAVALLRHSGHPSKASTMNSGAMAMSPA